MAGSRELSKQYQAGRTQAVGGLGMAQTQAEDIYGLGTQQSAATEALGLKKATSAYDIGMAGAASDYQYAADVADLGYRQQAYGIGKTEMDKFYGAMAEYGGKQSTYTLTDEGGEGIRMITSEGQKKINVDGNWVDATDEEYDAAYGG